MELVRARTQERGQERVFYSIEVDTRRAKNERETKDHLERNKVGWKIWNVTKAAP